MFIESTKIEELDDRFIEEETMRNLFKLALLTMLFVALAMTPALAKKKAPVDRTVIDGVTLAEVKPGSQMQPYYPATARDTDRLAEVFVSLQVLENGRVGDIDIVGTSIPGKGFEQSAQDAVKFWRFHPALKGGEAIETTTLVRLTFAPPTLRSPDGFIFVETSARNMPWLSWTTSRTGPSWMRSATARRTTTTAHGCGPTTFRPAIRASVQPASTTARRCRNLAARS